MELSSGNLNPMIWHLDICLLDAALYKRGVLSESILERSPHSIEIIPIQKGNRLHVGMISLREDFRVQASKAG